MLHNIKLFLVIQIRNYKNLKRIKIFGRVMNVGIRNAHKNEKA